MDERAQWSLFILFMIPLEMCMLYPYGEINNYKFLLPIILKQYTEV